MSIFEALMLICFGLSWPINIHKSWTARTATGKSLGFLLVIELVIELGYIFGMVNKVMTHFDFVFFLYLLNFLMVLADVCLYFRNRALDRAGATQA